ncbi:MULTISPECIES: HNH endonuclease signature motif containing protein [Pseudomonas]|uniref:HNH endonuclease signature motif containing protein n=1 Tax=Pseudomonas TaxID=286 RepID=UPI000232048B|nr:MULTISPECIES: HNH endonuclease signature motif containing protein [Pseudomonas]EHF11135.1 hypothetical protein HMPREF1030_04977 [Pseudomonas aeruginosa]QKQ58027.1 HNH endonuclease [Pseudomonas sp. FDAARGOS_761]
MTRSALSTIAYEALVRARRKFSNREERCIRETWTAEQELVLLRLYPDMPNEVLAARLNKTLQQICSRAYRIPAIPPRDWKGIHILLWEEHFGPIPTGHCVCFKDNNKQNVVIDNLELITRAERMRRNSIHRYPPELKSAIRVISKLKRTIQEVEHEEQD